MGDSRASHILQSEGDAEIAVKLHIINLKNPPLETRAGGIFLAWEAGRGKQRPYLIMYQPRLAKAFQPLLV